MALLISAYGARVLVQTGAPEVVYRRLRATLPREVGMEASEDDVAADVRYQVRGGGDDGPYGIARDGVVVDRAHRVGGLCRRLRGRVEFDIALRARSVLFVHAGVVARRGRAILIPGGSSAGKSTLVGELVRRGATYYSDEYAVIDDGGKVHPYARRSGPERRLLAADPPPPVEPALVIATAYAPGARWAPVVLEGARATLPLLDHLLAMREEPRRGLRLAARLAPRLVALQGPRPEAADVAPAILEFMDRILDGMSAETALGDAPRSATDPQRRPRVIEDPSWVPVAVTRRRRRVRFRRFERPFYIAHAGTAPRPWDVELSLDQVEAEAAALREPKKVIYVYHHGYAGSTLLFRLLDAPGICLAYDEPNVHFHCYAEPPLRRLCYRTFRDGETPLIKAVPSEIVNAPKHFADHPEARALFLYAPLADYIGASLARAYRRRYVSRMARFLGAAEGLEAGAAAAYCWQRLTAQAAALAVAHRLKTIEANAFFSDPARHLERVWAWFGFPPRQDWSETLARVGSRHSKTGRPFTFSDRLAQQRAQAEQARPWLDTRDPIVSAGRETVTTLARFGL